MTFQGKNVYVLGLGKSGFASARLLKKVGASVFVSDFQQRDKIPASYVEELEKEGILLETGSNAFRYLEGKDLLVVSPGVPSHAPILLEAKNKGIEILSEVELAFRLTRVPIIAVTGTNGKTTTTTLVAELLRAAGKKVLLGGNIGTPLTQLCLESADYIVAEISSFQMEYSPTFRPHIALFLNFTDDHLYRHGSRENYLREKMKLFLHQGAEDFAVFNRDDETVYAIAKQVSSYPLFFSRKNPVEEGAFLEKGKLKVSFRGITSEVLDIRDLFIKGNHNIENVLAALCVAILCGVSQATMAQTLRTFKGVPHRLEWVAKIGDVDYYNDSKGTNVDSTIKALESFEDRPIRLILGGVDKGGDLLPLFRLISKKVVQVFLIGECGPLYAEKLRAFGYPHFVLAKEMQTAVAMAANSALPGEIVLLSPACASFDQYGNYEERGDHFKSLVKARLST